MIDTHWLPLILWFLGWLLTASGIVFSIRKRSDATLFDATAITIGSIILWPLLLIMVFFLWAETVKLNSLTSKRNQHETN